jgi:predicted ester cyclase
MTDMKKTNRALIEARYEAVNAHDYDRFQSFYAAGVAWRDPATPRPVKGPRSVRKRLEVWTAAVPNLRWHLDELFGENDRVCALFTFTGSHKGPLLIGWSKELLPTGRSFRLQGVGVYVAAESQIVDSRIWFDLAPFVSA